jgi:hypothetical protein
VRREDSEPKPSHRVRRERTESVHSEVPRALSAPPDLILPNPYHN